MFRNIENNHLQSYNFCQLPYSNQTQQIVCQILVQTALEERDRARNLAPMIPLSKQIYVFNLIISLKLSYMS